MKQKTTKSQKKLNILGIIAARGGSKSIPKKNLVRLGGKPLLAHTIRSAQKSRLLTRTILTTDDKEIAAAGRRYGIEVPFLRPKELATDTTPDLPVFQHALRWLLKNENYKPDIIVQLRPTSPFRSARDIDGAISLLLRNPTADAVRSVSPPPQTPFKMWTIDAKTGYLLPLLEKAFPNIFKKYREPYNMPRQILPRAWQYNGYVEVLRYRTIMTQRSMSGKKHIPFITKEEWRTLDIDSPDDLIRAEFIFKKNKHAI